MSIEKAYNRWASSYDSNDNKTRDLDRKATSSTLARFDFSNVLELGCGTGKNTVYLIERAESITGLDFSDEMLKKAQDKITDPRVKFQKADLNLAWEVKNESFDLVTSCLTLEHIEDLSFIFSQASSKLVSNGIFYICELHPFKQYRGSKAKFQINDQMEELETYTHHISEYTSCAKSNNFEMVELNEWFDNENKIEVPRLISFAFRKAKSA